MSILLGTVLISCSANKSENTDDTVSTKIDKQNLTANSKQICPAIDSFENTKTIDMKDMMFTYFKYEGHICGTLEVKLDANKDWSTKGSGWFAAGFGTKTMKGSSMFIFVPKTLDPKDTTYSVFSNVGGGFGPTLPLDTKPDDGVINILSSSLGKVEFVIYPEKIEGLKSISKIDMIFSHSKAGKDKFAPGHVAKYDGEKLSLN
jgi:hypothetical protein